MSQISEPPSDVTLRPGNELLRGGPRGRIVLIDDDDAFVECFSTNLEDEGFHVLVFPNGPSAIASLVGGEQADVILLDWNMPGMNGLEVLNELRQRGITAPVILLTGLSDDVFEEAALAVGAIDFIDKTRRLSILVKRIELITEGQRLLPHPTRQQSTHLRREALELRCDTNRAFWNGSVVDLTLTEFRMVFRMALRPNEDVSYRDLYDLVHGRGFLAGKGVDGYRANIRSFIKRIRQKFRTVDPDFDRICSNAGLGYRWATQLNESIAHAI